MPWTPVEGNPPDRDAELVRDWPTEIVTADRLAVIVGLALLTVRGSQLLVDKLLFASPL